MRPIVVDCKGHLKGRLASVVAKQLLKGQHIVLVRCEEANVSGSYVHNKIKFMSYLHKTMRTNPSRGHRHFRAPSMMIYKAIRGMVPHKTTRGFNALKRLHVYDGCPPRYSRVKKMVIPDALRVLVMKPTSKYIRLGDLASQMGWNYGPLIKRLEKERLHYAKIWYHRKQRALKKHQHALAVYRHEVEPKVKKGAKKEEKKDEKTEEKTEEKKVEKKAKKTHKKSHFSHNRRRLHKLAIIKKVNKLEAAAKQRSNELKKKKKEQKKRLRMQAARKIIAQRKKERAAAKEAKQAALKKKAEVKAQRKAARKAQLQKEKKPTSTPTAAKAEKPKAAKQTKGKVQKAAKPAKKTAPKQKTVKA